MKETLSSDEPGDTEDDDEISHVDHVEESEEGDDIEDQGKDKVAVAAVEKSVKCEGGKLDKDGLNEFLVKLRRPITQAKVIYGSLFTGKIPLEKRLLSRK